MDNPPKSPAPGPGPTPSGGTEGGDRENFVVQQVRALLAETDWILDKVVAHRQKVKNPDYDYIPGDAFLCFVDLTPRGLKEYPAKLRRCLALFAGRADASPICDALNQIDTITNPQRSITCSTAEADLESAKGLLARLLVLLPPKKTTRRQRQRGPDLETSRQRIADEKNLRGELGRIAAELEHNPRCSLDDLKRKFPKLEVWTLLSEEEQRTLVTEEFKPQTYARSLTLIKHGGISPETLKRDRRKLRRAGIAAQEP